MNEINTVKIDKHNFVHLAQLSFERTKRDLARACYNGVLTGIALLKLKSLVTNVTTGKPSTKGEGFASI